MDVYSHRGNSRGFCYDTFYTTFSFLYTCIAQSLLVDNVLSVKKFVANFANNNFLKLLHVLCKIPVIFVCLFLRRFCVATLESFFEDWSHCH